MTMSHVELMMNDHGIHVWGRKYCQVVLAQNVPSPTLEGHLMALFWQHAILHAARPSERAREMVGEDDRCCVGKERSCGTIQDISVYVFRGTVH